MIKMFKIQESSSEDESTDESEEEGDQDGTGVPTAADPTKLGDDGLVTPSGSFVLFQTLY